MNDKETFVLLYWEDGNEVCQLAANLLKELGVEFKIMHSKFGEKGITVFPTIRARIGGKVIMIEGLKEAVIRQVFK